ncbi:MAG: hypothetical protein DWQ36_23765 [Acidobacteria bacterium]|nr:MAG: hypothetical protein DWQ30_06955 [Acidobacteriota bacterium]REK00314.1 MAG: hypothetical protein DWQ36_23765 [Acidobacteriota bacterium]
MRIAPALLDEIRRHGEEAYPEECCGVLLGRRQAESTEVVRRLPVANEREAAARLNRFSIAPRDLLAAQRSADAEGLEVVGYYHSHPDCPAKPSEHDRAAAWPDTSYLIVAVRRAEAAEARSWRLCDDRSAYREEAVDPAAPAPTPAAGRARPTDDGEIPRNPERKRGSR